MTSPRNDSIDTHYGNCVLHGLPCCSVCCKHESECEYGDCNKPMVATILCFRANGSVAERRDACRKHATYGPLGVGYDLRPPCHTCGGTGSVRASWGESYFCLTCNCSGKVSA